MKTFALFVSILVGFLAARNVRDENPKGFADAVSDSLGEFKKQLEKLGQGFDLGLPTAIQSPYMVGASGEVKQVSWAWGTAYDQIIIEAAQANGIDPNTLYLLLYQESRFRPDIIDGRTRSATGAMGIAQFMPKTAVEWLGSEAAALDPKKAIPGAARYLAWLRRNLGGDMKKAVAAYNWGIGNVQRKGLDMAPAETRNYVAAILPGQSIG